MTNDAPERNWASPDHWTRYQPDGSYGDISEYTEYTRADHAQAEKEAAVAAERDACAEAVEERAALARSKPDWCITAPICEAEACRIAAAIRDRAVANTDPLAARDAQVRAEALRDAARAVSNAGYYCTPPYDETGNLSLQIDYSERVILALIPADQEGDT